MDEKDQKPAGPSAARRAKNKRTTAVYFKTSADQERVRRAARRAGLGLTVFIREAALRAADASGRKAAA